MKIINPIKKKDSVAHDIRLFKRKFNSIVEVKVKLMEEFEKQVPSSLNFSVGYFEG